MNIVHSPSATNDIEKKLCRRIEKLGEINNLICTYNQGLSSLNNMIILFANVLREKEVKAKKIAKIDDSKNNNENLDFESLVLSISDLISKICSKTLADDLSSKNMKTLKKILFNFPGNNSPNFKFLTMKNKLPNSIFLKFHKTKIRTNASNYLQINNQKKTDVIHNLEPLNKFLLSLDSIKQNLISRLSTLQALYNDSYIFSKFPTPEIISKCPKFIQYLEIRSKIKNGIGTILNILQTFHTKIQRKQQQINIIVTDLGKLSTDMRVTLKSLEDEINFSTKIEILYRKIYAIYKAQSYYEFYDPSNTKEDISKWISLEDQFLNTVNTLNFDFNDISFIEKINSQLHSFSLSTLTTYEEIKKEEKYIKNKIISKSNLEANFWTKYPKNQSNPSHILIRERTHFNESTKSVNCAFECINTDIERTLNNLSQIESASNAFSSIFNLFKQQYSPNENNQENSITKSLRGKTTQTNANVKKYKIDDIFYLIASYNWELQLYENLQNEIENKKREIEKLKNSISFEKQKQIHHICNHEKSYYITTCSHTFCENCLKNTIENESYICPNCQTNFNKNDIIQINW